MAKQCFAHHENISDELAGQRGSGRTSRMQPIMLYQNRQVVFFNSWPFRARISSNSTVQLSALRVLAKFA
jgi:hypothetical protein